MFFIIYIYINFFFPPITLLDLNLILVLYRVINENQNASKRIKRVIEKIFSLSFI